MHPRTDTLYLMHHVRTGTLLIACTAIIIFIALVAARERSARAPANTVNPTFPVSSSYDAAPRAAGNEIPAPEDLMQSVTEQAPFSYAAPFSPSSAQDTGTRPATPVPVATEPTPVPQTGTGSAPTSVAASVFDPYSFIPRGIISISIPSTKRDAGQQELFDYGNRIGADIRSFESAHSDVVHVLKEFFDDRTNQSKAAGVIAAGNDYEALGDRLAATNPIPTEVSALHAALAESYRAVGKNMAALAHAATDKGTTDAVLAYDKTADEFTKNFVALVDFFSVRGVKFSSTDSGSMFTFNPVGL